MQGWYCWWKKSQTTTWHVWNPVNNGINCQPQLLSRISSTNRITKKKHELYANDLINDVSFLGEILQKKASRSWIRHTNTMSTQKRGWNMLKPFDISWYSTTCWKDPKMTSRRERNYLSASKEETHNECKYVDNNVNTKSANTYEYSATPIVSAFSPLNLWGAFPNKPTCHQLQWGTRCVTKDKRTRRARSFLRGRLP